LEGVVDDVSVLAKEGAWDEKGYEWFWWYFSWAGFMKFTFGWS